MENFCDSDKFRFAIDHSTHLTPQHHRELGEKNGLLYSPSVSWSSVVIDGVSLEKTFQFEDDILRIREEKDCSSEKQDVIIVNSRPSQLFTLHEEVEDKRWIKRLEKLYPMNYQEAKKLLINGFLLDVIEKITDSEIKNLTKNIMSLKQ